jgi:hypothetical protein
MVGHAAPAAAGAKGYYYDMASMKMAAIDGAGYEQPSAPEPFY